MNRDAIAKLRLTITENLRVQRGGADPVPYIDVGNVLGDVAARQNHAIFGRRGCGKTLLLQQSAAHLPDGTRAVYLNCEDFKKHSFPNVLVEILDALFAELETHLTGWFGRKKRSRELIQQIRTELVTLRARADNQEQDVRESETQEQSDSVRAGVNLPVGPAKFGITEDLFDRALRETEKRYKVNESKVRELDTWLPRLKAEVREFFATSSTVKAVFLQIDDFYHLSRADQPLVIDFIHRLCKDVPLYFKVATLRHASTLYADRLGQPIGVQERHDYQPISIDFTVAEFRRTLDQNRKIFHEFGKLAGMSADDMDNLFKGEGFARLVLAGGGVPRDCLSLFLEVLESVQPPRGDGRIGKDDIRILSRANFERRIEELKQDSGSDEQGILIRGIYVIRQFCVVDKKVNIMLVPQTLLQQNEKVRGLLYRLLDYRIIHSAGTAITHKSQPGTYHAFAIDIGCYAHLRKLDRKFAEIDLSGSQAKEQMRSAPILDEKAFRTLWDAAPADPEAALRTEEAA